MDAKIIFSIVLIQGLNGERSWSFDGIKGPGPAQWASRGYPVCGTSTKQSSIDIPHETVYDESLTDFQLHGYDTLGIDDLEIANSGLTAKLGIKEASVGKAYFTGGGFHDKYVAVDMHFHWGKNDTAKGCHAVHGQHYPLEMHIVHLKEVNNSLVDPPTQSNDMAWLVFHFALSETDSEVLAPYFDALDNVTYKGDKAPFGTSYSHFMGKTTEYYRYHGSMGFPPCSEVIQWTIFKHTGTVSSAQLAKLRGLYQTEENADEPHHIIYNQRPLQQLGNRNVKRNFHTGSVSAVTARFGVVLCSVLALVAL